MTAAGETAVSEPATYKQPSRKGKKAWRKNVDISEVQHGLEEVRQEVIRGGVIAEKPSDELFATDLKGDDEVAKRHWGKKLLKADEIIAQRSAVPGLEGRKRKITDVVVPGTAKRSKNGTYVSHRELQRLKGVADNVGGVELADDTANHDLWAAPAAPENGSRFGFLEPVKSPQAPETIRHAPVALTANAKAIPHVLKPHAGKSYNPLVGDWSALLEREGESAVKLERARLAAEAAAAENQLKAEEEAAKVEAQEREEFGTDYESAWESEWEGIQSEGEQQVFTQKPQRRKTPAERNKVKARKEREAREKWEQKQKQREAQEKKIDEVIKNASASGRIHMTAVGVIPTPSDSDDGHAEDVKLQRRRFGKKAVLDAPLEVVLPDELEDSLRRLKPEGNLLTDRYRNMLINGKIEVRKRAGQAKTRKTTSTERWSYKDWKLK